ncbi:MAG: hypothetical protein LBV27_10330 [Oscillospiraceae bacterium]|jgi:hypothetical protein|nr:hypothetical protein [Oscillospiraceae bacterium]
MSNSSDNKGKDGIITDKAELEKLLRLQKPLNPDVSDNQDKGNGDKADNKDGDYTGTISCYHIVPVNPIDDDDLW